MDASKIMAAVALGSVAAGPAPRHIGMGQQRAITRRAEEDARRGPPPAGRATRQNERREVLKINKRTVRIQRRADELAGLDDFRATRNPASLPHQGPTPTVFTPGWRREAKGFDFAKTDLHKYLNSSVAKREWRAKRNAGQ